MTAPAMSNSRPAIHGSGEKPLGVSTGIGGGGAGFDKAAEGIVGFPGPRRVGRLEMGLRTRLFATWLGERSAADRTGAGRGAAVVSGARGRAPGSRSTIAGVWTAGLRSARPVSLPLRVTVGH